MKKNTCPGHPTNDGGEGPTGTGCAPGYKADTDPSCQDHVFTECKNGKLCTTPVYDCFKGAHSCGPTQCSGDKCSGTQNGNTSCVDSPKCSTQDTTKASCTNIKAYNASWVALSDAQLSALKPNDQINFCVTGTASGGSFDKARFTINGALKADTTAKRPGGNDFCQSYTIPGGGVNGFSVSAQIHHTTLGWR